MGQAHRSVAHGTPQGEEGEEEGTLGAGHVAGWD